MAREFCPHHVSHYLGMDVHDTDDINRSIKLCPGMVITVEPGMPLFCWSVLSSAVQIFEISN